MDKSNQHYISILFSALLILVLVSFITSCNRYMIEREEIAIDNIYMSTLNRQESVTYLQQKFDIAAKLRKSIYFPEGVYKIFGTIKVKNGIRSIYGNKTELSVVGSFPVLDLIGVKNGESRNVSNLEIHSLTINANKYKDGNGVIPIRGHDINNCNFHDIVIKNMRLGHGFLLLNTKLGKGCSYNKIRNCRITGEHGINKEFKRIVWYPISLSAELKKTINGVSVIDHYKTTGMPLSAYKSSNNNLIEDNYIDGGNYGINVISEEQTIIKNNIIKNNVRNISLQWSCIKNTIENNTLENTLSSSILIGYGSSSNIINKNNITSKYWRAEAFIKIGLLSSGNLVKDNVLIGTDNLGGEYFLYIHTDSNNNILSGNSMKGNCRKAFIGIETAWNNNNNDNLHFAKNKGYDFSGFAHSNMEGNKIINNKIENTTKPFLDKIYLGEIYDERNGLMRLIDIEVYGNTFNGVEIKPKQIIKRKFVKNK